MQEANNVSLKKKNCEENLSLCDIFVHTEPIGSSIVIWLCFQCWYLTAVGKVSF